MSNNSLNERIAGSLSERDRNGLLRCLPSADQLPEIDLSANSYLALHENDAVHAAAAELTQNRLSGNASSRLISERSELYQALEKELSGWKQTESALVFNSGYAANVGVLQALCTRETEVFCDRLNHASIIDGILLSGARLSRYRHCDMADLGRRLGESTAKERLIVTDTVFSMDGDRAPLGDICDLAQKHECMVMADEAHATGVFGKRLSGLAEECGVEQRVDIRIGTLSKAVAGLGGFFAGSSLLRSFFVNHARSLIYSTGLPHSVLAWDVAAVRYIRSNQQLGPQLLATAQVFREKLRALGMSTGSSTTQIVPLIVGDEASATRLGQHLQSNGIKAPAIRPPTVPPATARIRFSIPLGLSKENTDKVIDTIANHTG